MAFFTIFVPAGLSDTDYQTAVASGPSAVSSRRRDHQDMLRSAGFRHVEETDVTEEFLITARAWYEGRERYADELRAADGHAAFEERQHDSRLQIEAIEAGLLRRSLFVSA